MNDLRKKQKRAYNTIPVTLRLTGILMVLVFNTTKTFGQKNYVYENGTIWETYYYDVIKSDDYSVFKSAVFETEKEAEMWDREANGNKGEWVNPISWIYKLTYYDGIESEIRIRKSGFTKVQADSLAKVYGKKMGQLPACLRKGVALINILKSDALFGGNNFKKSIDITIGKTSALYDKTGNMEETLFHESTHAALDYLYQKDWEIHRNKDPKFISKYAFENPNREDISESFLVFAAINYRRNRITSEVAKIKTNMNNRLIYYQNLSLQMYPFSINHINASNYFDDNAYYRLTCNWQGEGKSLDVINDTQDTKLELTSTGNFSGQYWKIKKLDNGYYRLTNLFKGEGKSLDVVNDGENTKIELATNGLFLGQQWKIEKLSNGYYRLNTMFQGEGKSLDVINDQEDNKLHLAPTGNFSGQYWKITKVK